MRGFEQQKLASTRWVYRGLINQHKLMRVHEESLVGRGHSWGWWFKLNPHDQLANISKCYWLVNLKIRYLMPSVPVRHFDTHLYHIGWLSIISIYISSIPAQGLPFFP